MGTHVTIIEFILIMAICIPVLVFMKTLLESYLEDKQ